MVIAFIRNIKNIFSVISLSIAASVSMPVHASSLTSESGSAPVKFADPVTGQLWFFESSLESIAAKGLRVASSQDLSSFLVHNGGILDDAVSPTALKLAVYYNRATPIQVFLSQYSAWVSGTYTPPTGYGSNAIGSSTDNYHATVQLMDSTPGEVTFASIDTSLIRPQGNFYYTGVVVDYQSVQSSSLPANTKYYLALTPNKPSCVVTYRFSGVNTAGTKFTANVTVDNIGDKALSGWDVNWTYDVPTKLGWLFAPVIKGGDTNWSAQPVLSKIKTKAGGKVSFTISGSVAASGVNAGRIPSATSIHARMGGEFCDFNLIK